MYILDKLIDQILKSIKNCSLSKLTMKKNNIFKNYKKISLNKCVFNKTLKMSYVLLFLMLFGKMCQSLGAAPQNALSPNVLLVRSLGYSNTLKSASDIWSKRDKLQIRRAAVF